MGNIIYQYRFCGSSPDKNFHISTDLDTAVQSLMTGDFLGTGDNNSKQRVPIVQLGIQALEGTRFYLNQMIEPITIGENGIFELKLDGVIEINNIRFDLASIDALIKNKNAILIIDTIYLGNT